ncbi:DUF6599 family protein [Gemmatimonadota bacterium]
MTPKRTRRILLLSLLSAGALSLTCSGKVSDFPTVEGWTQTGETLTFDAENLWEYINGAAELFVEYGVQTVRTADLVSGDMTVTVDLYDMGTTLSAFGVYERERPDVSTPLAGATGAVISPPYQALLLKGTTYVKVNVFEGELTEAGGQALLQALASSLPGPTGLPEELELLPRNGRIVGTEGYKPEAFLGQTELTECIYADYRGADGEIWEGFAVLPPAGDHVWESLAGAWESTEHNGLTILYHEVPYTGLVGVVRTEEGMVGVAGAADEAQLTERLDWLGS